jgi:hypothetical protein
MSRGKAKTPLGHTVDGTGSGKAADEDGQEERESQMSKGEQEEQFHE